MKTRLLALLCFVALQSFAASTWYVDPAAGGSHNGTSWANAWTSLSQITGVAAGDIVYLSGSTTVQVYTLASPWVPAGGTSGSRITYQTGQDAGHTGLVVFNCNGQQNWLGAANNINISGNVSGVQKMLVTNAANAVVLNTTGTGIYLGYMAITNVGGMKVDGATGVELDHVTFHKLADPSGNLDYMFYGLSGGVGANKIHNSTLVIPIRGNGDSAFGDDGFKWTYGTDIYSNIIVGNYTTYPGTQHADMLQLLSGNVRVFNNVFENPGESIWYQDPFDQTRSIVGNQFYNNICRNTRAPGTTVQRGLDWQPESSGINSSFTDCFIANNLFVDFTTLFTIRWNNAGGGYTRCSIINNVYVDCNTPQYQDAAAIFHAYNKAMSSGALVPANASGPANNSPVTFVSYSQYSANNDFHLASNDAGARNNGTNMYSATFSKDKDNVSRPQETFWALGPYEFVSSSVAPSISVQPQGQNLQTGQTISLNVTASGTGPLAYQWNFGGAPIATATQNQFQKANAQVSDSGNYTVVITNSFGSVTSSIAAVSVTNAAVPVISVNQSQLYFGIVPTNTLNTNVFTVQNTGAGTLSGSASASAPFAIASGGSYSLAAGASQNVFVRYTPTANQVDSGTVSLTGGGGASVAVLGTAYAIQPTNNILMAAATVIAPMVISGTTVLQPSNGSTNPVTGGVAILGFSLPSIGTNAYLLANVEATNLANNSFWLMIDQDASAASTNNIWDITNLTTGLQLRPVSWRGNGDAEHPQAPTNTFSLGGGPHFIYVIGREPDTRLGTMSVQLFSSAPQAPIITTQPQSTSVIVGSPTSFNCVASGTLPPTYQWNFNGNPIAGANQTTFAIASALPSDAGQYMCTVTNAAGSINSFSATLLVQPSPYAGVPSNTTVIIQ